MRVSESNDPSSTLRRREFLAACSALGVSGGLFPGVLYAMAQDQSKVTPAMIEQAEQMSGLQFSEEQRKLMEKNVNDSLRSYERLRRISLQNAVAPAVRFDPLPAGRVRPTAGPKQPIVVSDQKPLDVPGDLEELAFSSVAQLSNLLRTQAITSVELTEMYLARLKRYDEKLHCVITLTEELAMEQARNADAEISKGKYRGPLHGIPWGAKDLLNTKGIRTTYGAEPFEQQVLDDEATVVERLREAGAVLIAKLSLGALAMGDVWFGGMTRNPWNVEKGSSGSSAGSACATAAGLVGFGIGTETLGSIVSPCTQCGVTGLRPTFGRVSRAGAMALCWTMDKIGPICRTVEDCALVLHAIHGADGRDPTAVDVPFHWDARRSLKDLKIGYLKSDFESRRASAHDKKSLEVLQSLGVELIPIELPDFPVWDLRLILNAEAGAAFEEITRNGEVNKLKSQGAGAWPNSFRSAQLIPAVEYLRANRIRTLLMEKMAEVMDSVDLFVSPSGGTDLMVTNLTGHPCIVVPNGFEEGQPQTVCFTGRLYGEAELMTAAKAYQDATDFHLQHPSLES